MVLASVCVPAGLAAQHATGSVVTAPEYEGCNLCHGTHPERSEDYGLRTGDGGPIAGAPGLGGASKSCLRCHSTSSERLRQPEFSAAPMAAVDGKYLQYDLTDDHPLGQVGRRSILDEGSAVGDPRKSLRANVVMGRGFEETGEVECTLCHNPHDRHSIVPGPEEQKVLCGSCHEPATYAFEGHPSLACGNCHDLHGGQEGNLLAEPTSTVLCNSCHEAGGVGVSQRLEGSGSAAIVLPPAPRGHTRAPEGDCVSCHRLHE